MREIQIHDKIQSLWQQWPQIKDTVPDYGFQDWIKSTYGFTYVGIDTTNYGRVAVVDKVLDEEKYMWFLLQC